MKKLTVMQSKNQLLNEAKKRKKVKSPSKELAVKNKKHFADIEALKNSEKSASPIAEKIKKLRMKKIKFQISANEKQIEIYKLKVK